MDHGEILPRSRWNRNARDAFGGRRKRGEKRKGQMPHGLAKLGTVRSVPGIDGVERWQLRDPGAFDDAQQVEAGIGDRAGAVSETDQREQRAGSPDFGVSGARGFESGQREDDIADGAGANQEPAMTGDQIACRATGRH